ncbi:hypothetical protein CJF32_00001548 [Rutstroemia sp. NJR-2017a WRK4]|nr:hypothetical protein CJF32_00001548 [Rutstroemia sp. NJR-2017a WRK4]
MSNLQLGVEALLKRNLEFAKKHEAIPTFAELAEMGVDFPHIIVCMLCPYTSEVSYTMLMLVQ